MGFVNFDTNIFKDVEIDVNVNLDIFKNVTSFVDITGNLATAEASADAIGGGGGGGGGGTTSFFLIDNFNDDQIVEANVADPSNSGVVDLSAGNTSLPENEDERFVFVEAFEVAAGANDAEFRAQASLGNIDIDAATDGLVRIVYGGDANGDPDGETFSVEGAQRLTIEARTDGGPTNTPEPIQIIITHGDGTSVTLDGEIPVLAPGVFETLTFEFADFTGIDPNSIDTIEIRVPEGTPEADTQIDLIGIEQFIPDEGGGTLSETETFAQVIAGEFSQSFSSSVAAASFDGGFDSMILG